MQHGRMVLHDHLFTSNCCYLLFSTWCLSTGKGVMCAINRSSIFFLLSIQIHLCDLVRTLYVSITARNQRKFQGLIWKVLSAGMPCLLMAISYGGLFEFWDVCHGSLMVSSCLTDKRMPSVECRENCETNENYQLNVARHAFSCSMRFGPIWSVWYSHAHYIMPSSHQVLRCICFVWRQVFQHGHRMGWVSLAPFWVSSSLSSQFATFDVAHYFHGWRSIRIGVGEKGLVWWGVVIFSPNFPFLFDAVTLMTFSLVTMLQKGPFHLEQRIYDFVLPGLWHSCRFCCHYYYDEAFVYIHLNFFATDNWLKWNDPF